MKIINTTSVFPPCWDMSNAVRRLIALGYDGIDLAFDYCTNDANYPFMTAEYEEWARSLREQAEKAGASFTHSHASFDAAGRGDIVSRTLRCASILGIKYLVVHPVWHKEDGSTFEDAEEFIAANKEIYRPILCEAEKYGIVILSENLLWGASVPPKNIADLVAAVDSPYFGWCYDVGHAHTRGHSYTELLDCSRVPVSLHIHDNNADGRDDHLIPGDGTLDWDGFAKVLKQIRYPGEFVLEAHHQSLELEDDKRDDFLAGLLRRAIVIRDAAE